MNPVPAEPMIRDLERPRRKLWCAHYERCLDLAAGKHWKGFTCAKCKDFQQIEWTREDYKRDELACQGLMAALFKLSNFDRVRPGTIIELLETKAREERTEQLRG